MASGIFFLYLEKRTMLQFYYYSFLLVVNYRLSNTRGHSKIDPCDEAPAGTVRGLVAHKKSMPLKLSKQWIIIIELHLHRASVNALHGSLIIFSTSGTRLKDTNYVLSNNSVAFYLH